MNSIRKLSLIIALAAVASTSFAQDIVVRAQRPVECDGNSAPSDGRMLRTQDIVFVGDATLDLSSEDYVVEAGQEAGYVRAKVGGLVVYLKVYMPPNKPNRHIGGH